MASSLKEGGHLSFSSKLTRGRISSPSIEGPSHTGNYRRCTISSGDVGGMQREGRQYIIDEAQVSTLNGIMEKKSEKKGVPEMRKGPNLKLGFKNHQ